MKASWGSLAGKAWVDFVFSVDGKIIDLSKVSFPSRGKEEEKEVEGIRMRLINNDSSRNKERVTYIEDEDKVRAIIRVRFSREVFGISMDGVKMGAAPSDAEVVYGDGVEARAFSWGVVVVIDGKEIVLVGKRPKVALKVEGGKIIVSGDTYPIKEELKSMKARWDPQSKAWVLQGDVEEIRKKLVEELGVEVA